MAFKRALWHSGLKYRQTCKTCNTLIEYDDTQLDFRPWYADGFVYCPKCKTPLRHSEGFAVDENGNYLSQVQTVSAPATPNYNQNAPANQGGEIDEGIAYCPKCGKQYKVGDTNFCTNCGNKLTD
jgi:predicted amidophosphoribosyltransferase